MAWCSDSKKSLTVVSTNQVIPVSEFSINPFNVRRGFRVSKKRHGLGFGNTRSEKQRREPGLVSVSVDSWLIFAIEWNSPALAFQLRIFQSCEPTLSLLPP